jgi:tRNA uridine 5-carboxymethylaminomethyl modification enzyme
MYEKMNDKYRKIYALIDTFKNKTINIDKNALEILHKRNKSVVIHGKTRVDKLLKRPEFRIYDILEIIHQTIEEDLAAILEMEIKYEGYIRRDQERILKIGKMEEKNIPGNIDYKTIQGLKTEAREKLMLVRPETLGQAMRISGVDPPDISILMVHIEALNRNKGEVPRGT